MVAVFGAENKGQAYNCASTAKQHISTVTSALEVICYVIRALIRLQ